MSGITPAQHRALAFIRSFVADHGFSPSYREIADALELGSASGAHRVVHLLAERGSIRLLPRQSRSIELVEA